jgi:hypothetical protein
MCIGKDYDFMF